MGVCAEGNSHAFLAGDFQKTDPQVLSIRVAIDLDSFIKSRGFGDNRAPVGSESLATVSDPWLRVTEDLDLRVTQTRDVTGALVLLPPQRRVKAAQHEIDLQTLCLSPLWFRSGP